MIINGVIICDKCKAELQPNNILIGINDKGRLFRKCCFYNNEEELKL